MLVSAIRLVRIDKGATWFVESLWTDRFNKLDAGVTSFHRFSEDGCRDSCPQICQT